MKCTCGYEYRKGSGGTAFVLAEDGSLQRSRVCGKCLNRAIVIVSGSAGGPRELLTPRERETRDVLRSLSRHLRGIAVAYRAIAPGQLALDGTISADGFRVAGLEAAADIAEAWASNPTTRKE